MAEQPAAKEGVSWPPKNCVSPDILVDKEKAKDLLCHLCGKLCIGAMEMDCDVHDGEVLENNLFGKVCIEEYVASHGKCPIGDHPNPKPHKSKFVRLQISKLTFKCPKEVKAAAKDPESFESPLSPSREPQSTFYRPPQQKKRRLIDRKGCKWTGTLQQVEVSLPYAYIYCRTLRV